MTRFGGRSLTIVTASDDAFVPLLLGLWESLGSWQSALAVIDIGLGAQARGELQRRGIRIIGIPGEFFNQVPLLASYFRAMYLRPSLPQLIDSDLIMWIDADCWIQRLESIEVYLNGAVQFPDALTICPLLDVDYPRCIRDYAAYQANYSSIFGRLFGAAEADFLYGKAIFSSGVFAAHRDSQVWMAWRSEVRAIYENNEAVRTDIDLGHIAEQAALNKTLHHSGHYNCVTADHNWHCHCSEVIREGSRIVILPSRREPAIIHLCNYPRHRDEYHAKRLLYERPAV